MGYISRMGDAPLHTVVETPDFIADAKRLLSEEERWRLVGMLAAEPRRGDLMVGTGGARKMRWARRGAGKSGGYRVVFYYGGADLPVFLLGIFAKNERINLSQAERNELAEILGELAKTYRQGVQDHVQGRR